jgi:hypothetical protein
VPFSVLRLPDVRQTVEQELSKRERRAYEAAVEALRGEGCRAGGKRLAADVGGDYPLCQRALYGEWRMITAYLSDGSIAIVAVARHTESDSPSARLAESFPGLAPKGRRRVDQPPCCEDPASPPTLSPELESVLFETSRIPATPSTRRPTRRRQARPSGRRRTRRPSATVA